MALSERDVPVGVCFRDQRQAVADPLPPVVSLRFRGLAFLSISLPTALVPAGMTIQTHVEFVFDHGVSGNTHNPWRIGNARCVFGYAPEDSQAKAADQIVRIAKG